MLAVGGRARTYALDRYLAQTTPAWPSLLPSLFGHPCPYGPYPRYRKRSFCANSAKGPRIGRNTVVHPSAVLASDVVVGDGCSVGANVVVQNATIGDRVIIHPGTCIGQDGFGFHIAEADQSHEKKPQRLNVVIHDDVEIGANCCVDRGSWRDTVIGAGTKIDNLVQIGHNVVIGQHCLVAAQSGIAGSTIVGDRCLIGGQVGVAQHLTIGAGAQIAAKSGVMSDLEENRKYGKTWVEFQFCKRKLR